MKTEQRTEVLEREIFPASPRKDGHIPTAPQEALAAYGRFKREWQQIYPVSKGVAAVVWLRSVRDENGKLYYAVTKELVFDLRVS